MKALRIIILVMFILSVAATILSVIYSGGSLFSFGHSATDHASHGESAPVDDHASHEGSAPGDDHASHEGSAPVDDHASHGESAPADDHASHGESAPVDDHASHGESASATDPDRASGASHSSQVGGLLHVAHITLVTITFLLIAAYLLKSADIASRRVYRELRFKMTVDPSAGFVEALPSGYPISNACIGALAKNGIFVKSIEAMSVLAGLDTVAAEGNSISREGYAITEQTLGKIGVRLSDNIDECKVKIKLGAYSAANGAEADFILTHDKVTHLLIAIYVSRIYIQFKRLTAISLIAALAAAAAFLVFQQYTYAGAMLAVFAAIQLIFIHRIEIKTTKLSFDKVIKKGRNI